MKHTLKSYDDQLFKDIITYAETGNVSALKAILQRGFPLDPLVEMATPAGYLARAGNHKAVKLLMDDLGADVGYVIDGYAASGDYDRAFTLAEKLAKKLPRSAPSPAYRIALAAACRNEFKLVEKRLDRPVACADRIVMGYAKGGHVADVDRYIKDKAPAFDLSFVGGIIYVHDTVDSRCLIDSAAFGFSIQKHFKLFDQLLIEAKQLDTDDSIPEFNRYETCLCMGAIGYAQVGEFEKAQELVNKGAHINFLIKGAAIYGDTVFVEELVHKVGGTALNAALEGFKMRDCFRTPATTIQLLAFMNNLKNRESTAQKLQSDNKTAKVSEWLEKANKLNGLMHKQEMTYDQALKHLDAQSRATHAFMPAPSSQPSVVITEREEYHLTLPMKKT